VIGMGEVGRHIASAPMRRDARLGFVAQAGVVLGLSLIVQENLA